MKKHDKYLDPFLIAEIGVNHEGSVERAKQLIEEIAELGWHCVKFQTYKADTLASKNSPAYWDLTEECTATQHELFKKYDQFAEEDYSELARFASECGVEFLSTPFDSSSVSLLDKIQSYFKIASADITNIPLLREVGRTNKHVFLSIGASERWEIRRAIDELKASGSEAVTLLHCVLNYPTPIQFANLGLIQTLKNDFPDCAIGYSDHVKPDRNMECIVQAILMGATVIEKHYTYDRSLQGNDHYHAFDYEIGKSFMQKLKSIQIYAGSGGYDIESQKAAVMHARRSIVAKVRIKSGDVFSEENLITKRPGHGISSINWDEVIGKKASRDILEDDILSWADVT